MRLLALTLLGFLAACTQDPARYVAMPYVSTPVAMPAPQTYDGPAAAGLIGYVAPAPGVAIITPHTTPTATMLPRTPIAPAFLTAPYAEPVSVPPVGPYPGREETVITPVQPIDRGALARLRRLEHPRRFLGDQRPSVLDP